MSEQDQPLEERVACLTSLVASVGLTIDDLGTYAQDVADILNEIDRIYLERLEENLLRSIERGNDE